MQLAAERGGVVINADSMQVYRELSILTARPSPSDEAVATHRLYGHVPAAEAYSVGRYLREAEAEITIAIEADRVPIVVGGTGLYFKALIEGSRRSPTSRPRSGRTGGRRQNGSDQRRCMAN